MCCKTLEPSGVCARNLAECLAIQLKDRDRFDPAMQALVEHLDLLARRDLPSLRKLCGVDEQDLFDMVAELRALDPKPGLAFGSAPVQPVIPDVFVRKGPDDTWAIELNSDTLPKVLSVKATTRKYRRRPRIRPRRPIWQIVCSPPVGWSARSTSGRRRY